MAETATELLKPLFDRLRPLCHKAVRELIVLQTKTKTKTQTKAEDLNRHHTSFLTGIRKELCK
jgi:hypothetical protein